MRLKKLEIYGFKSFAERTEMVFEQGITGVVGPNGSGKSNISDAVRWVLGEQSAKTLRGSKMEDVIFGGTEKRKRLAWCEVALVFDNADRALPLDFAEIAVTRRVYRNGESEYMINHNPCRLRDVVDLFRDTGIGKEGYSLIGQGRIDEILSVKSEDRRQVFEEAAGIVKYKSRKTEAEKRLENTRLNLSRVEDMISELEGRLEPLRLQSQSAREYLQLQGELKGLELNAFLLRTERYNQRIAEQKEALSALSESVAQAESGAREAAEGRDAAQAELTALEASAAAARENVQELIREVEAGEGEANVLKERRASAERERTRLEGELEKLEGGGGALEKRLLIARERLSAETVERDAAEEAISRDTAELSELGERLIEREQRSERIKGEVMDVINRLSDVKSGQARLTAMEEALKNRLAALDAGDDEARIAEGERAAADTKAALERERAKKAEIEVGIVKAQARAQEEALASERLTADINAMTVRQRETGSRLKLMEELKRDFDGYQHSVKQVLMQARRLNGGGVRGVVADVISVPRELERAIDMALGAAVQNVVVDTEEDAKRMIEYLRVSRLGRATFLPLSAVSGRTLSRPEREALSLDGCLGVASELISFAPEYRGIAENLLGRTVVARDLDAGIAIMRKGRHAFRLVTLEGDVMNPGGSMTGGSVASRTSSLLSRDREIAEHRKLIGELTDGLAERELKRREIEEARQRTKRDRALLYESQREQEINCAREEARLNAAWESLAARRERAAQAEAERARMLAQLEDVRTSLSGLTGRQGDEEQLSEGGNRELQALAGEIAGLRERVNAARRALTDARVAQATRVSGIEALEADIKRMTGQKCDDETRRAADEERLAERGSELERLADELAGAEAELAARKERLRIAREDYRRLDGERMGAQKRLVSQAERLDALRTELEALGERRHKAELLLSRVESELEQLTGRIWEDYQLTYAGAEAFRTADFKLAEAEKRVAAIRARIRELGSVNVGAVDEYRQTQERYDEYSAQRDDLNKAGADLDALIRELVKKMETQFKASFEALNENFKETFASLFGGGRAQLQLSDPSDALNCGIEIVAQPPGKKLQMLSLLSGGERALTAIAILFAMLKLKPTPFCILDEIEAALDDANIDNFAAYLQTYSRDTQFVIVTHRKGTMEKCDALYGVTMEEKGVSRMMSVKLSEAIA